MPSLRLVPVILLFPVMAVWVAPGRLDAADGRHGGRPSSGEALSGESGSVPTEDGRHGGRPSNGEALSGGSGSVPTQYEVPAELLRNLVDPLTVPKNPAFADGEHLHYRLGWSLFTVARATLTVRPDDYAGQPALRIDLQTTTNSFADAFYKVRNHSTSWVAADVSRSFEYCAVQREGGRERDTQAFFDTVNQTARYVNHLRDQQQGPVDILPGTFDPMGIVFFIRSIDFEVGDDIVIPTSNGKEFFYTIVHVVKKVEKRFAIGKREAYVLEPDIKDIGGVFKRSPDGSIRFYISADAEKLPLRMESEVAVGRFWADLVEIGDPQADSLIAVAEVE
jgi:hypothetical protein